MRLEERPPVDPIPFLIAWTRAVIEKCRTDWVDDFPNAAKLSVDKRGDVDDYHRYPLVIADITTAVPVENGPSYGAGAAFRARWLVQAYDTDEAYEAISELVRALIRSWREHVETSEGWVSYMEVDAMPMFSGQMVSTADITEYTMMARIVARRR